MSNKPEPSPDDVPSVFILPNAPLPLVVLDPVVTVLCCRPKLASKIYTKSESPDVVAITPPCVLSTPPHATELKVLITEPLSPRP